MGNKASLAYAVIDQTLADPDNRLKIKDLCRIAGVSRSGYYAYKASAARRQAREEQDRKDFDKILEVYKLHGYAKGMRTIKTLLEQQYPPVIMSLKKISRLEYKFNLVYPLRKKNPRKLTQRNLRDSTVAPNIVDRNFKKYGPRIVLLTDITYLPYGGGKTAYLSAIKDGCTNEILAHVVGSTMEEQIVLDTVMLLLNKHEASLSDCTVIHSDQGSHYTSCRFIELVKDKKLRQSMSHKGCCWDNAPMESFWGHMKDHVSKKIAKCTTLEEIRAIIDDYMDYYNNECPQWDLAKLSPAKYYQFYMTGDYPFDVPNPPAAPHAELSPEQLYAKNNDATNCASDDTTTANEKASDISATPIGHEPSEPTNDVPEAESPADTNPQDDSMPPVA